MKERLEQHELPSKMGGEKTYLPPIEVVVVDGVEIGVHPDYKEEFLRQRKELCINVKLIVKKNT